MSFLRAPGVSTESGIPDFRSPGGLWTKFDPEDFTIDKFLSNPETRQKQWRFLLSGDLLKDARPNAAHEAIAELEELGRLDCVITQNIDNLHQKAGNDPGRVYELHGNMKWIRCLDCGNRSPLEEILKESGASEEMPVCGRCGGILKPDVIFFGEALPEETLREATWHANHCDLLIVVGSSLVVYPAAYMPLYAKQSGAKLVIVNLTPTPVGPDRGRRHPCLRGGSHGADPGRGQAEALRMCLILFAWKMQKNFPLILIANRDEFYERPTAPAAFWDDAPDLLAGRDLREGGTWLGITRRGKLAALTNYRDPASLKMNAPSRGHLVSDYLRNRQTPENYLRRIKREGGTVQRFQPACGE